MAISVTQAWTANSTSAGTSSMTFSPPSNVAVGAIVVAYVFCRTAGVSNAVNAFTSSLSDTGQLDRTSTNTVSGQAMVSIKLASGLTTSDSLTIGWAGNVDGKVAVLHEIAGLDTTTWVDVLGTSTTNSGTTTNGPSVTPTSGDRILITGYGDLVNRTFSSIAGTPSTHNHSTARVQITGFTGADADYLINTWDGSTAGQGSITYNATGGSRQAAVSYKAAVAGSTTNSTLSASVTSSVSGSNKTPGKVLVP